MLPASSFLEAIGNYEESLDENQKTKLLLSALVVRNEQDMPWFLDVIEMYSLRDKGSQIVQQIHDLLGTNDFEIGSVIYGGVYNDEPLLEAKYFLLSVQERIKVSRSGDLRR